MAAKICILCPGQGAQVVGMGKDFFEVSDVARAVFEKANSILGFDLAKICLEGPEDRLNQTDISQPAIYVTGVACLRAASDEGKIGDLAAVTAWAGLSLGEYTALHLAGVVTFEDGLLPNAIAGTTIVLGNNHVHGHVAQFARQVTGIRGLERGVGETLAGAMGGDEVF